MNMRGLGVMRGPTERYRRLTKKRKIASVIAAVALLMLGGVGVLLGNTFADDALSTSYTYILNFHANVTGAEAGEVSGLPGVRTCSIDNDGGCGLNIGEAEMQTTRTGYTLAGWYYPDTGETYVAGDTVWVYDYNNAKTVYAMWVRNSVYTFAGIQRPDAITNVSNGVAKTAEALGLPGTVTVNLTNASGYSLEDTWDVVWDVEGSIYEQGSPSGQTFNVTGSVELPSGISNNDNLSLDTTISVQVLPATYDLANPSYVWQKGASLDLAVPMVTNITSVFLHADREIAGGSNTVALGGGFDATSPFQLIIYKGTLESFESGSYTLILKGEGETGDVTRSYGLTIVDEKSTVAPPTSTLTLSFDANGGVGGPGAFSCTATGDSCEVTVTLDVSTDPTRSGYVFKGWANTPDATTGSMPERDPVTIRLNENITYYAVWESEKTYTMAFDNNGGFGGPGAFSCTTTSDSCEVTVTLDVSTDPLRHGYIFKGWASTPGATTGSMPERSPMTIRLNENITFYAVWELNSAVDPIVIPSASGYKNGSGESLVITPVENKGVPTRVVIDGVEISTDYYTVDTTTGAVTISSDYLNTLDNGSYEITIVWADNTMSSITTMIYGGRDTGPVATPDVSEFENGSSSGVTITPETNKGTPAKVVIDGEEVPADKYTVNTATGAVTISPEYLDSLSDGNHDIMIVWADGTTSSTVIKTAGNTNSNSAMSVPNTGAREGNHGGVTMTWVSMGAIAVIMGGVVMVIRKRVTSRVNFEKRD